ncbi:GLE1-like protein-domain-containing protein [Roridomyces roridus]|uniref:mRNA export factor GLE1 n=1 Tax=Roridomyces roridus TaxID=1738132 RepID=A0AAD7CCJ5_9AGAR|nr:GLE1-like protein-domain-containing protein [Roridomyces roridus]
MRFSVPRSLSPSPVRRHSQQPRRNQSTFGLLDSDDSESDGADDSDDSFCYASESEVPQPPIIQRAKLKSTAEQRHVEDTVTAIRLRTRHHDPYEEWEKQTRKDAFRVARKKQTAIQLQMHDQLDAARNQESQRLAVLHSRQMAEVQAQLDSMKLQQQKEEDRLRQGWQERDRLLWKRIDSVIQLEEDKVRARLEAERKIREQEERKRQEEDMRKRLLEEKRLKEEEEKQKAVEEEKKQKLEEKKQKEEQERQRLQHEKDVAARIEAEGEYRKAAGLSSPREDWVYARSTLMNHKENYTRPIKSDKARRAAWGEQRRKITPRIGQLTNDPRTIRETTDFIHDKILVPPQPHPPMLYHGLLSSLAKTILMQAETEVTAEKKAAIPLAQVAFTLLDRLESFPEIFFAKLVQRCGGWPIPCGVPAAKDFDGRAWKDDAERTKVMGYRRSVEQSAHFEQVVEYMNRVAGNMRLYWHILKIPPQNRPMHHMFQLPRCWTWFARIMSDHSLLETPVAAQLIYTALDVLGVHVLQVWGQQWVKMLELIYQGATDGFADGKLIGGTTGVGTSARMRVRNEVERIMASPR